MTKGRKHRKLNNQGSALVLVLTILSFIAILGAITMSTALLNIKMRGLNRDSDKNFYHLEVALDEIYAQTGRMSSEILKEEYAGILSGLYKTDMNTNEKANAALKKQYIKKLSEKMQLTSDPISDVQKEENCQYAASAFKQFATSFVTDTTTAANFTVAVESVTFQKAPAGETDLAGLNDIYSGVSFNGLCLIYLNPDTDIESSLTVDMKIDVPYVRFINSGSTLFDYVLVANEGITIGETAGNRDDHEFSLNGNIYGNTITVNNAATVAVDAGLMTAAGNLTVKQGILEIGNDAQSADADEEGVNAGRNRVWATGLELDSQATLSAENTEFYIQDDMTLKNGGNQVSLSGGYYGYGNEGMEEDTVKAADPKYSSAILLNGKKDVLDLRKLDSLMLAGRAYLRFKSEDTGSGASQSVYPLGESLAVRSTQSMYLVPEECMTVSVGGTAKRAEMNPVLYPEGTDAPEQIEISVDTTKSILGAQGKKGTYTITGTQATGEGKINSDTSDGPAFFVAVNGKIYVYYNFENNSERSAYFKEYLKTKGDSFEALLKKGGQSLVNPDSGIYINEDGQLLTSGALYQVAGKTTGAETENEPVFELLRVGQDEISTSLKWVDLGRQFKDTFNNLKTNLSETKRVTGTREAGTGPGKTDLLPMGNYVRISKLEDESQDGLIISKNDVDLTLNGTWNGLVVSGGDVEVRGNGTFNGLIIAKGNIAVNGDGKVIMNADSSVYEALLEDEDISKYFYDYGDAASTVLNNYEDFVTRENWSRTGLERGGKGHE